MLFRSAHAVDPQVREREAEQERVRQEQQPDAEVVLPTRREIHDLERDLEREAREEHPEPPEPQVRDAGEVAPGRERHTERDHQGDDREGHGATLGPGPGGAVAIGPRLRAVDDARTFPREPEGDGRVLLEVRDGVGTITIDRPERRNAMSFSIMRGLREAVAAARADDAVRVVVLTGAGDRAFCSGADLGGIGDDDDTAHDARRLLADLFRDLWSLGKPTIARVRGLALAGGLGIALACDIVVASEDAGFAAPEVSVGLWPYMITVPMLQIGRAHV